MTLEQSLAMVHSFTQGRYEAMPLDTDPPIFTGSSDYWILEAFLVGHHSNQNAVATRNAETSLGGTVRIRLATSGRMKGVIDGHEFALEEGDVGFDANEAGRIVEMRDFDCIVFTISAASIGYDPAKHVTWRVLDRDDPATMIFASAARAFLDRIHDATRAEADRMGNAMLGLIRGMIGGLSRDSASDTRPSREFAIRRFIEEHISDPDLSTETLLDQFPMSRSVLYREFKADGGVSRYIMARRMARGLHMLVSFDLELKIVDIAHAVGVRDQRYFARQFRKHFGMAPTDARREFQRYRQLDESKLAKPSKIGQYKRSLLKASMRQTG